MIRAHGFAPVAPTLRACASGAVGAAGVCAVAQSWADAVSADGAVFSAAVLTTRCDQIRRTAETLRDRLRVPLFVMNIPATRGTPAAERLLADERRRLDAFLSRVPPGPSVSTAAALEQSCASEPDGHRVGVFGCCLTDADRTVLSMLDEVGLRVVFDATEHPQGTRPFIGQRPNEAFFAWLDRRGRKARLAGWVLLRQPWCDLIHAEVFRLKRGETGLPWLVLETGARPTLAALRTRAEAFAELLEQAGGGGDV